MMRSDITHFRNSNFPFGLELFKKSILKSILQVTRLIPIETNLIAYCVKEKKAVGFLRLTEHTKSIYSIKYVFTTPQFRKKGVASGLINRALTLAKNKNALKVFLTADYPNSVASKYYFKIGFKPLTNNSSIYALGFPKNVSINNKNKLNKTDTRLGMSKEVLLKIYTRCMGEKWLDYFETNKTNLINGFSQDFKHLFIKYVFVNDSQSAFALVFYYPMRRTAKIEMYSIKSNIVPSMIKELYAFLKKKGITYSQIMIFNVEENMLKKSEFKQINEMDFAFNMRFMGKFL
jgi:N-acetylglutamate synthase-like GNAT family acetyltransferase